MKRLVLFAIGFAVLEAPALACQCDDFATMSVKEQEERARWIAGRGIVVAEVERVYQVDPLSADAYKVVRPLVGQVPGYIRVPSRSLRLPDGHVVYAPVTSCDYSPPPAGRHVIAFIAAAPTPQATAPVACGLQPTPPAAGSFALADMCTQYFLQARGMVDLIRRIVAGERG